MKARLVSRGKLRAPAVVRHAIQGRHVDAVYRAHVHGHPGAPILVHAPPERLYAAIGAEQVLYDVLVEAVGLELLFSLEDSKLLRRRELEQHTFHLAVRAVAFDHGLREIELYFVSDIPAVAGAFVFFHIVRFYRVHAWLP